MITETNLFSILQFLESKNGGLSPDPFPPLSLTDVCAFPFFILQKKQGLWSQLHLQHSSLLEYIQQSLISLCFSVFLIVNTKQLW